MTDLSITYRPIESLTPHKGNPRTHSKAQIRQIAKIISAVGFTNPILVTRDGEVLAGHGRLEAAKQLGMADVPTITLDDMTPAQKRAYVIADNKIAENAGWDREALRLELEYVIDIDPDFDITLTGFETAEIDLLIGEGADGEPDPFDKIADPPNDAVPISRPGDLWQIGPHRLLCGDALDPAAYGTLMGDEKAQAVFTDPPYNVPIDGHVCGLGVVHHPDFAMASGEMSESEFAAFLQTALGNLVSASVDGALHYICMDWRHVGELLTAARPIYSEQKNLCVWNKTNAGMGSLYRSKHELVFVFKAGSAPHINNVELGRLGRYRTNVWDYAGITAFGAGRAEALATHPTVKPVAMVADAIQDCTGRGDIVLDAFAGSGTTLLAAERTGRRGYAMELDPGYVDAAVRRISEATGHEAIHVPSGITFTEFACILA